MRLHRLPVKVLMMFFLILSFIAPILFYAYKFGVGLWTTHNDWALMGTALGGVYGPITSVMTCIILFIQIDMQRKEKHNQRGMSIYLGVKNLIAISLGEIRSILDSQLPAGETVLEFIERTGYIKTASTHNYSSLKEIGLSSMQSMKIQTEWYKVTSLLSSIKKLNFDLSDVYHMQMIIEIETKIPLITRKVLNHELKKHSPNSEFII
ncbi:hypothetical protein [Aeromonas salmonicida]|uniref:hypothetical protein n=1 Tax=Aeromonas salmonicida TaxID=645 RepID=UPI003F7C9DAB